ncbi:nitrate reductase molybdenum cofactor assembly chaperone [Actinomadura rubrisoli]|uniref:Nitrate reductase molybdenum cofactor assembly chaperone n=1 Tax=Actinomadura rubrisoli TaxID=2530368 RepID=A0A4R5CI18_9ACTN|nr:nitrate reductase molybdenum cofactor assembly chaperone [Actinomadura rubrisoli]TDD98190.1 nitrate reductase molybdenum cofactor assembly chaperone [Actinomadura rubrisoli]
MSDRLIWQSASLLLAYPGPDWPGTLALVADALAAPRNPAVRSSPARALARFCAGASGIPVLEAQARYVETFDRDRRRTLHMTYYTDGDTRARGARLVAVKALYRRHGWEPAGAELPDFLPAMLEFAARCPRAGDELLRAHRPGLELLRLALHDIGDPYEPVVRAVCATLPGPRSRDRAAARALARTGPPTETVGAGVDLGMPPFPAPRPVAAAAPEGPRR